MRCEFTPHAGEFPDEEFWRRDDGQMIHEVDPRHTAKGRLVLDTPDAAWQGDDAARDPSDARDE